MIVEPKIRGFICTTAHPDGCAANVLAQINYVKQQIPLASPPKKILIIGASTGYGLASRITTAFGGKAATIGVFFERPADERRTATAGWYNTVAFEEAAHKEGLYAKSINGDAFSYEVKKQVIDLIQRDWGGNVDLVIYSLASPKRVDPTTNEVYSSVLKTIGAPYTNKNIDVFAGTVKDITIEPATQPEIDHTIKVMGGEDWELWIDTLLAHHCLSQGARTLAYHYIGPKMTYPIYHQGTIGRAKAHLEETMHFITQKMKTIGGQANISVNKALVTQASSAIPVVPLYISILYKVMKEKKIHEGCIEQIERLFQTYLTGGKALAENTLLHIDDWEMREDVQQEVSTLWETITTENLMDLSDLTGYRLEFQRLFGFSLSEVDYAKDVDILRAIPSII
jgi:enoyl-[acyl-carrier protein] reductase/trans-2-enoyl-CoA reductase (NAD+)